MYCYNMRITTSVTAELEICEGKVCCMMGEITFTSLEA
jgi:hypothetical protein